MNVYSAACDFLTSNKSAVVDSNVFPGAAVWRTGTKYNVVFDVYPSASIMCKYDVIHKPEVGNIGVRALQKIS